MIATERVRKFILEFATATFVVFSSEFFAEIVFPSPKVFDYASITWQMQQQVLSHGVVLCVLILVQYLIIKRYTKWLG